jgi:hypothetical protein
LSNEKLIIIECLGCSNEEVRRLRDHLERIQLPCEYLIVPKEIKVFTREDWRELIDTLDLDNPSRRRS